MKISPMKKRKKIKKEIDNSVFLLKNKPPRRVFRKHVGAVVQ